MEAHHVKVYTGGKISIPYELRNKMHIQDGDDLLVSLENNKIVISTYDMLLNKAQNLVKRAANGRDLSSELKELRKRERDDL